VNNELIRLELWKDRLLEIEKLLFYGITLPDEEEEKAVSKQEDVKG
jgi:hypothetical protein